MKNTVLITGANGFIGRKLIEFYRGKHTILAVDFAEGIQQIEDHEQGIFTLQCDLTKAADVKQIKEVMLQQELSLKYLILAHGAITYGKLDQTDTGTFHEVMDCNLGSVFLILNLLIPVLIENQGGSIVALASQFGSVAAYDLVSYCTAKAALIQMIRCVALDYADCGIIANTVSPGILESTMKNSINNQQNKLNVNWKLMTSRLPIQQIKAEDIISLVDYLLTQKSFTGNNVLIDGGYTIR